MFFKLPIENLLEVDENFVRFIGQRANGDIELQLHYIVNQGKIIDRSLTSVNVKVLSRSTIREEKINSMTAQTSPEKMVDEIRLLTQRAKAKSVASYDRVIVSKKSDMTAKISNAATRKTADSGDRFGTRSAFSLLNREKRNEDVEKIAVLGAKLEVDSETVLDEQEAMLKLINSGKDPSIVDQVKTYLNVMNATSGIAALSRLQNEDPVRSIIASRTSNADESSRFSVVRDHIDGRMIDVATNVVIPSEYSNITLKVVFELIDSKTGFSINTVERNVDLNRIVQAALVPKVPPTVVHSYDQKNKKFWVEISQNDEHASLVEVFIKKMNMNLPSSMTYVSLGTFPLKVGQAPVRLMIPALLNSPMICRAIAGTVHDVKGFDFTSCVLRVPMMKKRRNATLTTLVNSNGITVKITDIPQLVTSIIFLRRDATLREKEYTVISDVMLIDPTRQTEFVDTGLTNKHVYEYTARAIFSSGSYEEVGYSIVEFNVSQEGKVTTKIQDMTIIRGDELDVKFTMNSSVLDGDIDIVKKMLEDQGLNDQFIDDVTSERDRLKNLIAHDVKRVNLTTGEIENFGVVSSSEFSDADLHGNANVKPLQLNNRYRYEVVPLLRAASTLLKNVEFSRTDRITKKTHSVNPSKHLHPIRLNEGTIVSQEGVKSIFGKSEMLIGSIGVPTSVDVTFDLPKSTIVDQSLFMIDSKTIEVSWRFNGNLSEVDHFSIVRMTDNGVSEIVGKAHSSFPNGQCVFIDTFDDGNIGEFSYKIIPIYNDYTVSSGEITSTIVTGHIK